MNKSVNESFNQQQREPTADTSSRASHPYAIRDLSWKEFARECNWVSAVFLVLTPMLAFVLTPLYIYNHGWSWGLTAFLLITYSISNLSITVCYHRYFAHRSFDVPTWMQILFLLIASSAFQGSALRWASDHRRHHREIDTDEDPYTIKKGFFHAHLGWMLLKDRHPDVDVIPLDLKRNRWVMLQDKHYVLIASFMGFIVPGLIGMALGFGFWPGVLIGGLTRIVLSQHSTFLINSAAHTFGNQPYTDKNTARDSATLAVLTFGEGYHNYHHYFQADYRNGVRWYQWDPTKWVIRSMALVGLAKKLKKVSADEILKARIAMDEKRLLARGANQERVQLLRERIVAAQARWKAIQIDMARYKADRQAAMTDAWKQVLQEKREELELARIEMNNALRAWKSYVRTRASAQAV
ncbi:MAG: fatty acid desaturase [Bdellovibrionales bacterium]|jgi:stearoyl-CoA desaturase (delta-9 desaturase)|nr:fatty acid desaturase [Bdellovibrionales bacterium]